jgi:hypothetical protein
MAFVDWLVEGIEAILKLKLTPIISMQVNCNFIYSVNFWKQNQGWEEVEEKNLIFILACDVTKLCQILIIIPSCVIYKHIHLLDSVF